MQKRHRFLHYVPPLLILCAGCGWLGYIFLSIRQGPSTLADSPGSPIDLRGGAIVLLRLPDSHSPQNVIIYSDGTAIRDSNPHRENAYTDISLTSHDQAAVQMLIREWCRTQPTFHSTSANARDYEIGIRCSNGISGIKQFTIPRQDLPDIFHTIDTQLPPL